MTVNELEIEPWSVILEEQRVREKRIAALYPTLILILVFLLCFAGGVLAQRFLEHRRTATYDRPLGVFWEAWDLLETNYFGDLPSPRQRTYGAIRGVLGLLEDPYTTFLEPQTSEVERDRLAGEYGGIGVNLWFDPEGAVVLSPYPDSPAAEAGVTQGDILLAIDGTSIEAATLDDIRVRLRGEVGTTVTLTLARPPTPSFDLTVSRAQIRIPSVTYRVLEQAPTIGYLHINSFTGQTPDEFRDAIDDLQSQGVTGLVLDLRDNGGGLIEPAVDVVDLFLGDGVILYEVRKGEEETVFRADRNAPASDLPLAVLTNGSSASAAEIVAGAIQRRGRGVIVGESTYGKGSVQLIYTLSDGSCLHVTAAVWLLPDRERIGPEGLTPDIEISRTDSLDDPQLDRAVRYLQVGE